jgi:hypothetical protein
MTKSILTLAFLMVTYGVSATPDANILPGGLVVGRSGYLDFYTPCGQATATEFFVSPTVQLVHTG